MANDASRAGGGDDFAIGAVVYRPSASRRVETEGP